MAHLVNFIDFVEDFHFRVCPNETSALISVEEFKTSIHISVRRIGWHLPEYSNIIVPKRTRKVLSDDVLRELAVLCVDNLIKRDNLRYANV